MNQNGSFLKRFPSDASPSGTPHRGILNDSVRMVDRLSENVDDILDNMSVHSQTWREYDRSGPGYENEGTVTFRLKPTRFKLVYRKPFDLSKNRYRIDEWLR